MKLIFNGEFYYLPVGISLAKEYEVYGVWRAYEHSYTLADGRVTKRSRPEAGLVVWGGREGFGRLLYPFSSFMELQKRLYQYKKYQKIEEL